MGTLSLVCGLWVVVVGAMNVVLLRVGQTMVGTITLVQYLYFALLSAVFFPLKAVARTPYLWIVTYFFNLSSVWVCLVTTFWGGTRVFRYGVDIPPHHTVAGGAKNAGAVTFNHLSFVDAMMLGCFMATLNGVTTRCFRWISIAYLLYLPHGWMHWMRDDIFVAPGRASPAAAAANEANIVAGVEDIADPNHMAEWLFFSPEGSVQTPKLYAKSLAWAKKTDTVPLKHHLLPRTKAFALALSTLGDSATAIYDVTLGYPEAGPAGPTGPWTPSDLLTPRPDGLPMHVHCRKVDIPDPEIVNDEAAFADWVYQFFVEKDALLDDFYKTGSFPDPVAPSPSLPAPFHPSFRLLIVQWFIVFALPATCATAWLLSPLLSYVWP